MQSEIIDNAITSMQKHLLDLIRQKIIEATIQDYYTNYFIRQ